MVTLLLSAVSVAFFHSLAPDHWLPFVAIAKASNWRMSRLIWVTCWAGLGHVVSSLLLGLIGLWAGLAIHHMGTAEAWRGHFGTWLLIGFGIAYALWGLKHARHDHSHVSVDEALKVYAVRRFWMLFAIIVFGPCEPLIPLMFMASGHGMTAVWIMSLAFSAVTIGMILTQSTLSYAGFKLIRAPWLERYAHALAGLAIIVTAFFVLISGV